MAMWDRLASLQVPTPQTYPTPCTYPYPGTYHAQHIPYP